jgi:ArsR family transcriptional regulator
MDPGRAERWFHALSDQTRLRIIELLGRGDQCVCDLTAALETGQSRLSFHLKTLKDAGLVCDRRQGRWTYYSLNAEAMDEVRGYVDSLRARARGLRTVGRGCE